MTLEFVLKMIQMLQDMTLNKDLSAEFKESFVEDKKLTSELLFL